jgi:hypothetical protein
VRCRRSEAEPWHAVCGSLLAQRLIEADIELGVCWEFRFECEDLSRTHQPLRRFGSVKYDVVVALRSGGRRNEVSPEPVRASSLYCPSNIQ